MAPVSVVKIFCSFEYEKDQGQKLLVQQAAKFRGGGGNSTTSLSTRMSKGNTSNAKLGVKSTRLTLWSSFLGQMPTTPQEWATS